MRHLSWAYAAHTLWLRSRRLVAPGTKPEVVLVTLNVWAAVATIPARFAYRLFAAGRSVVRMPGRSAAVRPFVLAALIPSVYVGMMPASLYGAAVAIWPWKPKASSCFLFDQVALSWKLYVFTLRPCCMKVMIGLLKRSPPTRNFVYSWLCKNEVSDRRTPPRSSLV